MELLESIKDREKRMQRNYEKIMRLKSALEYTAPVAREGGKWNGGLDPTGDKYAALDEYLRDYFKDHLQYAQDVDAAEELLEALGEKDREIFRLKYYDALPWREVAERMDYSVRQCQRRYYNAKKRLS